MEKSSDCVFLEIRILLSLVTFVAVVQSAHSAPAAPNSRDDSRIQQQFAQLPLRFEENRGQFDRSVRYAARGTGQTLYLTSTGPAFVLRGNKDERPSLGRIAFDGASADPAIIGEGQLDSTTQYFVGNGPKNWRLDIASFGRVRYRNIYPGVDVVYYAKGRELEYDLVLAPEANPELVGLRFEGFDTIGIDRGGGLVLRSATGDLRQKRPVAYQTVDGRRCLVSARYVRRGRSRIGLALGDYDRDKPLVIDPLVLFYAGYLGGNTTDQAFALAVDSAGNAYVAGSTESLNFPVVNAVQPALKGTTDIFISKINTAGNALLYSTYLGGSGLDAVLGIALDPGGNLYVTGYTNSTDFPVTPGVVQSQLRGKLFDAFVAKIAPNGTVQYSTYLGGHYVDTANAIAVDSVGNAYVAGFTCSYDFPTRNAFQPFLRGGPPGCFSGQDAFVSKLNSDATALVYSTFFGGSDKEEATAIALDSLTRAAIAGYTVSNDLPTSGPSLTPYRGGSDAFVARFDAAGGLDYSSWFGGTDNDTATGIAVGKAGDLYVSGYAASDDLPTSNAFQPVLSGPEDGFVLRFGITATSANIVYSTYIGGGDSDRMHAIAVDAAGNAYVTGYTESIDFPLSMPLQPMLKGPRDAVVASIGPTGTLAHSTFLGGSDLDDGWAIAIRDVPRAGTLVHVAGETLSTDLGTNGAFQPNAQGASDGFVARLGGFP